MANRIVRFFWGDLSAEETKKFGLLSFIFFVLIGVYWYLRVMKDAHFSLLVGYRFQPLAKGISLGVVIFAVLFYNKLIDMLKRTSLFYVLCGFFGLGFIALGYLTGIYATGQNGCVLAPTTILPITTSKLVGWVTYCVIESFGSLLPALFWSYVASSMTTESAKRGYGMVFVFGQLGLIIGTSAVARYSSCAGLGMLFMIGGIIILSIPFLISLYAKVIPAQMTQQGQSSGQKKESTGVLEGLRLLISLPYVAGLFVVTTAYEVIGTIVEYQMGLCVTKVFPPALDKGAGFAAFKAMNGTAVGILSLLFALLGTSIFMRKFGLKFCLTAFPATIGIVVATSFIVYMLGAPDYVLMWVFFAAVVIFKGLSYTLNNPAKEVMYIPTSKDVKFKAKSYIDAFGGRASKGTGAIVTGALGGSLPLLIVAGTGISLGIVAGWFMVALFVGNTFNKLQAENKIIG